jgi:hypothetical protein
MLMRDPWLGQGPDGTWHMLWTWGWSAKKMGGTLKIGYASSKDLIHWSPQRALYVMENEPTARNLWARGRLGSGAQAVDRLLVKHHSRSFSRHRRHGRRRLQPSHLRYDNLKC